MSQTEKPIVDRPCPKCGGKQAFGPEYRRGVGSDELLGEHLRFYCTTCRYMTSEPTADQDTPARRQQLEEAFARHRAARRNEQPQRDEPSSADIERIRRQETSGRRGYGWK